MTHVAITRNLEIGSAVQDALQHIDLRPLVFDHA